MDHILTPTPVKHVAIYARFSKDKTGRGENVADQVAWGHEFAEAKYPHLPVRVYVDNSKSASRDDVRRDDFERLGDDIVNGEVAIAWASETSRFERRLIPWLVLLSEWASHGVEIHTRRDGFVPPDDIGSEVRGVVNANEVRQLKKRMRERMDRLAAQGRASFGGTTFGYDRERDAEGRSVLVVNEAQAELVREAAARVLAGEALSSIASDLHSRDVKGSNGGNVGPSTVKSWVTSATVAGKRQHGKDNVFDGTWEPILTEDVWRDCTAKLERRKDRKERPGRRTYLLSGLIHCGECRGRMTGAIKYSGGGTGKHRSRPSYECKSCHISMAADAIDDHVTSKLLDRLDKLVDMRTPAAENKARRAEISRELGVIDEKRKLYGVMLADDDMDPATYQSARQRLAEQEAALTSELADMPVIGDEVDPDAVRLGWSGNTMEEHRRLLGRFIERVVVDRARPGAPRKVDLGRVHIEGSGWA